MTITEQGRRWEVKEAMRVTMREQRRQRDELWRMENNNRNWMALSAHARGDRSLPSQFKEVHQSGSTTGVWNLVLIVKLLRGRRRRRKTFKTSSAGKAHPSVIGACANAPHAFQKLRKHSSKIKKRKRNQSDWLRSISAHCPTMRRQTESRSAETSQGKKGGERGKKRREGKHFEILQLAGFNFPPF